MNLLSARERAIIACGLAGSIISLIMTLAHAPAVATFAFTAITLAVLAAVVGTATEQLAERLGPGATGVLQGALGNLPELFIGIFSLRAGLITVVQSALVGSILANNLLVLGAAFLAGGLKNGTQVFSKDQPRMISALMLLAVSALIVPTIAVCLKIPASAHVDMMSVVVSIVLLSVFVASIPNSMKGNSPVDCEVIEPEHGPVWPLWMSGGLLALSGVASGFVSDWFVDAMQPAIGILHISQAFTGLVIVAIAGNAVENAVGVQLAIKNEMDYAVSVILNSSLQVALCLTPLLVLTSFLLGGAHLTLVMPPLMIASLFLCTLISTVVAGDGESIWLEGVALIGLYLIIATAFWWG